MLVVFAGVALAVATLSINNTFSITVAQRTRELGLLRVVGASRRQIRGLVFVEALVVGVVAAAGGVVAGLGVAGLLKGMFDAFGGACRRRPHDHIHVGDDRLRRRRGRHARRGPKYRLAGRHMSRPSRRCATPPSSNGASAGVAW